MSFERTLRCRSSFRPRPLPAKNRLPAQAPPQRLPVAPAIRAHAAGRRGPWSYRCCRKATPGQPVLDRVPPISATGGLVGEGSRLIPSPFPPSAQNAVEQEAGHDRHQGLESGSIPARSRGGGRAPGRLSGSRVVKRDHRAIVVATAVHVMRPRLRQGHGPPCTSAGTHGKASIPMRSRNSAKEAMRLHPGASGA